MGLFDWLDFFSFAWLRRCKTCGERGSKCVCKRPSVALEHIFFLEERKNKYGARNFSHVSDTVMTVGTNSTTFTNSTIFSSSTANAAGFANSGVNFNNNNTVIMGGGADSVSECASVDYIHRASSQPSIAGSVQGQNYRQLPTTTSSSQHRRHHRRSRRHQEPEAEPASGALVRKHSGRMVRKAYSDTTGFSRFEELPADYPLTAENLEAATSSHGSQRSAGSHTSKVLTKRSANTRQQQDTRTVTFRPENPLAPRHSRLKKQGSSFKFYGRGGSGVSSEVATGISSSSTSTGRAMSSSAVSSDAIVVRSSNASSSAMGSSFCSDRMSVDNNYGSYNPRAGRMIEGGYAPSIQEEEEVLQRLDGWLHSSPTSTADSFMMSRAMF